MSPKIALLFLTIDNPHFPHIWDEWLRGHEDQYDIYIHPKNPEQVTWRRECMLPSQHLVQTKWGQIVYAYGALFRAAIATADRYRDPYKQYILISESCLPVQSFNSLYRFVCSNLSYYHYIDKPSKWDCEHRLQHVPVSSHGRTAANRITAIQSQIVKHDARFSLCHEDAVQFVYMCRPNYSAFVHELFHAPVSDEFCLSAFNLNNFVNYEVTHDCWHHTTDAVNNYNNRISQIYDRYGKTAIDESGKAEMNELRALRDDIKKSPIAIDDLHALSENGISDLDLIIGLQQNRNAPFFCRKFAKTSNVSEFWHDIIGRPSTQRYQKK